ncbi:MAG: hypothetical protein U0Y96_06260 [Candidatus Kapaibacterium sp.]
MKHSIILLAIALLVTLSSCEQTVELGEVPYLEKIVVDGMITSGDPIKVTFSKTMPPTTSLDSWRGFDTAAIRLTNVVATITVDNQVCTLQHIRVGEYFARKPNGDTLYCEIGKTYILNAQWNGHIISATTTAPQEKQLQVNTAKFTPVSDNYPVVLEIDVKYKYLLNTNDLITNSLWITYKQNEKSWKAFHEVPSDIDSLSEFDRFNSYRPVFRTYVSADSTSGRIFTYNEEYVSTASEALDLYKEVYVLTESYDHQFLSYLNTEWNNNGDGDFFGASGQNVSWNIKGDGLGLFLAKTNHKTPIVFK